MPLSNTQKERIQQVITTCLRNKFQRYNPESSHMPFHYRLLGKDRMALFSFIQSLNTTFGISIFEPVAVALAQEHFRKVQAQYIVGNQLHDATQQTIQEIMNGLSVGTHVPNKMEELSMLRASLHGQVNQLKTVKVDLFVETHEGEQFLFDLKTAKPNISNFKDFKRTLLEWAGIVLSSNKEAKVNTLIAIPYNPYEPQPYQRWTLKGMLDDKYELLVAEEFWNFLGGEGAYDDLLDCFEKAGIELRPEIDAYFGRFNHNN